MKITVIGASGKAGRAIATEAEQRGHQVYRIGHTPGDGIDYAADVLELSRDDLANADVVVDALGFFTPDTLDMHSTSLNHLLDILAGSTTRLVVVGGAGSLYMDDDHSVQLYQTKDFPESFVPLASAQARQLDVIRENHDVDWTFVSPAAQFDAEGVRTGGYVLAGELFETNDRGESVISYADYAIAIVDECESGEHIQQRISVHSR